MQEVRKAVGKPAGATFSVVRPASERPAFRSQPWRHAVGSSTTLRHGLSLSGGCRIDRFGVLCSRRGKRRIGPSRCTTRRPASWASTRLEARCPLLARSPTKPDLSFLKAMCSAAVWLQHPGVPSLLDALLPGGASTVRRRWLRQLLLLPPPPSVAIAIHSSCALLSQLGASLPEYPVLPTNNIVLKLRNAEASDTFFRELRLVLAAVLATLEAPALAPLAEQLMVPTNHETGLQLTAGHLAADCRQGSSSRIPPCLTWVWCQACQRSRFECAVRRTEVHA